jgi:hypothetical protein
VTQQETKDPVAEFDGWLSQLSNEQRQIVLRHATQLHAQSSAPSARVERYDSVYGGPDPMIARTVRVGPTPGATVCPECGHKF